MGFKKSHLPTGITTPNIEKSMGVRPSQFYVVANYLPLVRFDDQVNDYVVISYGKVVARDNSGFLVPAGLAKDVETAVAGGYTDKNAFVAATASFANVYTSTDVQEGVKNAAGDDVVAGEPVVASFFEGYDATASQNVTISSPLGVVAQNAFRQNGAGYGNGYTSGNPVNYRNTNWNLQAGVVVLTRYFIELPVVADLSAVKLPGMVVFEGTPNMSGLVTFTAHSNFTSLSPLASSSFAAASAGNPTDEELKAEFDRIIGWANDTAQNVIGRIYFMNDQYPQGMLDYVRTYDADVDGVKAYEYPAGMSTSGLPQSLYAAGVSDPTQAKTVRINLLVK